MDHLEVASRAVVAEVGHSVEVDHSELDRSEVDPRAVAVEVGHSVEVDHLEEDPQEVVHLGVDHLAVEEADHLEGAVEVGHLAGEAELAQLLRDESTGRE